MVTRPTATVTVTIDAHSAEVAEAAKLRAEEKRLTLEQARVDASKRGAITRKIKTVSKELEQLDKTVASGQIHITVTALTAGAYRNLLKNHPPKDGDQLDEKVGYDVDTFGADLIRTATLDATDHEGQPYGLDLDTLLDDDEGITPYDFEQWFRTALALQTQGGNRVPLLRAS